MFIHNKIKDSKPNISNHENEALWPRLNFNMSFVTQTIGCSRLTYNFQVQYWLVIQLKWKPVIYWTLHYNYMLIKNPTTLCCVLWLKKIHKVNYKKVLYSLCVPLGKQFRNNCYSYPV